MASKTDQKELFKYSNHLGFNNPYYRINDEGKFIIHKDFNILLRELDTTLEINPLAINSIINRHYIFGDQTIVKDVYRTPWMAYPDQHNKGWIFHEVPPHSSNVNSEKKIALQLFHLICEEITEYIENKKRIGVLLSGGMDSRILAGCVNYLVCEKKVEVDKIVAYTWGLEGSRDVEYARQIANSLGWQWKHYIVDNEALWENYKVSGERGCEYSGLHLHAMPKIAKDDSVDVFLAGSYGDSVGRGEYSGKKVSKLRPIELRLENFGSLLANKVFKSSKCKLKKEIDNYHHLFPRDKQYMINELDYQLHYMRRMLNPCMEVINEKKPLRQIFTSPKVFRLMWGLDINLRNDTIYYQLLKLLPYEITSIPWARTGKRYGHNEDLADNFTKTHQNYQTIIQKKQLERVQNFINENLDCLPYLQITAINAIINEIRKYPFHNFDYLETITWIVSYIYFVKRNKDYIKNESTATSKNISWRKGKVQAKYFIMTRGRYLKNKF